MRVGWEGGGAHVDAMRRGGTGWVRVGGGVGGQEGKSRQQVP